MSQIYRAPWVWEYHPDFPDLPMALVSPDGDVVVATGDSIRAWAMVAKDHECALQALPDLLAACEGALKQMESLMDEGVIIDRSGEWTKAYDQVVAAIAKATGDPS